MIKTRIKRKREEDEDLQRESAIIKATKEINRESTRKVRQEKKRHLKGNNKNRVKGNRKGDEELQRESAIK